MKIISEEADYNKRDLSDAYWSSYINRSFIELSHKDGWIRGKCSITDCIMTILRLELSFEVNVLSDKNATAPF